jgi:hypothetical protein
MTQAQLDIIDFTMLKENRSNIKWYPVDKKFICTLDDRSFLELKRSRNKTVFTVHVHGKSINLSMDVYETICDLKLGIQLLHSFMEGNV